MTLINVSHPDLTAEVPEINLLNSHYRFNRKIHCSSGIVLVNLYCLLLKATSLQQNQTYLDNLALVKRKKKLRYTFCSMTVTFNIRISAHPKRSTKEEKKSRAILRGHAQKIFVSIHSQKRRR